MNQATFSLATLAPAMPEIVLLALVSILLIADLFFKDHEKYLTYWLTLVSLAGTAILTLATVGRPTVVTFQGMFVADPLSQMLKVATLLTVAATLVLGRSYLEIRNMLSGEFLCLALSKTVNRWRFCVNKFQEPRDLQQKEIIRARKWPRFTEPKRDQSIQRHGFLA